MKKIFFVTLFSTVIVACAQAQFGVNLGANLANIGGKDAKDNFGSNKKIILRPHFGFYYNATVCSHFSIQSEVGYSPKGVKVEETGVTGKVLLNYICLGALARWNIGSGFYLGTGPEVGIAMSAKTKVTGQPDENINDVTKGSDFGWMFRAGYDFPCRFGFYAGFSMGLGTIDDESDPVDIKNRVIQFGVRYSLHMMKKK